MSAANVDGAPRSVVELVAAGAIQMVTCPRLHDELEGVLARDRFLRWMCCVPAMTTSPASPGLEVLSPPDLLNRLVPPPPPAGP